MKRTSLIPIPDRFPWLTAVIVAGAFAFVGGCGGGGTQSHDGSSNGDATSGSGGRAGSGSGGAPATGGATATGGVTGTGGAATGSGGTNAGTGGGVTGSGGRGTGGAGTGTGGTGTTTGGASGSGGRGTGGAGMNSGGAGGVSSGGRGGATVGSGGAGTGTGGAGGGTVCGTSAGCPSTQFCDFGNNSCGTSSVQPGMCKPRPQACPANVAPTCACDHQVYSNSCLANTSGQDASDSGGCTAPTGKFACGSGFCNKTTEYCTATVGGVLGLTMPGQYVCTAFPASCTATPTCACLKSANCTMSADGDVRVMILVP